MDEYKSLMRKAVDIAGKARGLTSPNPLVGCLIYDEDNKKVLGEGFHIFSGGPHAEVNAIQDAILKTGSIEGMTLITTLEPCCHRNKKTPPCTELILNSKLKKVIIGALDPNPFVSGQGVKFLNSNGVRTLTGVLKEDCEMLNEVYNHNLNSGLPFLSMKVASSVDGKIALNNGESKYITSEKSREVVHNLRFYNDAVLVGLGTVIKDNPKLDIRLGPFKDRKKDHKIIIYGRLEDFDYQKYFIFKKPEKVLFINYGKKLSGDGFPFSVIPHDGNWRSTLEVLYQAGICSIIAEPGKRVFKELIESSLVNKIYFHQSQTIIGAGHSFSDEINITDLKDRIFLRTSRLKNVGNEIHFEAYL